MDRDWPLLGGGGLCQGRGLQMGQGVWGATEQGDQEAVAKDLGIRACEDSSVVAGFEWAGALLG